ncbi:alpha/beta hydrolase [Mycobacterium sp.]|uniref:alpha/beta hydrolase n=1 Tax=Mycobacterium sp. TaxID=1785 RepID=UPI002D918115|nr:alpha/beta hydrolase [Mycobacterium sp.]
MTSPITTGLVTDTAGQTSATAADVSALSPDVQAAATVSPAWQDFEAAFPVRQSLISSVFAFGLQILDRVLTAFRLEGAVAAAFQLLGSRDPFPLLTLGLDVQRTELNGFETVILKPAGSTPDKAIVAIHGGGFTLEITQVEWLTNANLARDTGAAVVVPLYPSISQGGTAATVVPQMADLIAAQIALYGAENVSVEGGSAGGTIGMAAVQELVRRGSPVPARMVFLSPALDLTFSDPRTAMVAARDPIINIDIVWPAHVQWAGDLPGGVANPMVSPALGSLEGLPPTWIYSGSLDLLSPGILNLQQRAIAEGAPFTFILLKGGIHGWPGFFFLPEAIAARPQIASQLVGTND